VKTFIFCRTGSGCSAGRLAAARAAPDGGGVGIGDGDFSCSSRRREVGLRPIRRSGSPAKVPVKLLNELLVKLPVKLPGV
jgi:hypothetical protein